jgi:hypothetical protein
MHVQDPERSKARMIIMREVAWREMEVYHVPGPFRKTAS